MEPYLGEIKMTSFNWAPKGWALCDGSILSVNQNQALFSLLGNIYGGTQNTTFALPDLRGRTPLNTDFQYYQIGKAGGVEGVAIDTTMMPAHTHQFVATSATATAQFVGGSANRLAALSQSNLYAQSANLVAMGSSSCSNTGGGGAHQNMQPSLVINFIIAIAGIYPQRS